MKARLLEDLAAILVVLAVAEHRTRATEIPALDTNLDIARDQLVNAARRASDYCRRPDGILRSTWAAAEVGVMGVVAFVCAYAAAVPLDLPRWLTVLVVIVGQVALAFALLALVRQMDARLASTAPPAGWPGEQPVPDIVASEDVAALLTRARSMVGQLAVQRLGRVPIAIRSGPSAQWVGRHDAFLLHLHHADAHLCGAHWVWTKYGDGVDG
jgi:hypothetical protein